MNNKIFLPEQKKIYPKEEYLEDVHILKAALSEGHIGG